VKSFRYDERCTIEHDGKDFADKSPWFTPGKTYEEWTVAEADAKRGADRVI
jgi:hypothetical protein